ncbi:MAG TPA: hypothetical protein DCZ94_03065 [Lentisphaeria bacterium]|nr:MAG: hypothetical protein A2X48_15890 [Lentisphaerae bacterium GWF2_49_21]HBC85915.1 hypothetical protein [Lentisphaeria bacterium]
MVTIGILIFCISIIGLFVGIIGFVNINSKLQQKLYKDGKDPNPPELEFRSKFYGIHNYKEYYQDSAKRKEFRKQIDPRLAKLYEMYLFIMGLSLVLASITLILTYSKP